MKNYSYVGISLIILIFGIIFIPRIIERVKDHDVVRAEGLTNTEGKPSADASDMAYVRINGERKKAPHFEFVDQNGDTISNEDYRGKVYVVEFFFSTCPSICPIMRDNLVEVQKEFAGNDDFGIASFSIDPTHDTPEVLKEYAETYGITHPNWHLMTGDREKIYDLANKKFNIYSGVDKSLPGGFSHSGLFALVDKDGYLRSRKDEYGNPIVYYRGHIKRHKSVAEGEEAPQIDILIEDIKKLL